MYFETGTLAKKEFFTRKGVAYSRIILDLSTAWDIEVFADLVP